MEEKIGKEAMGVFKVVMTDVPGIKAGQSEDMWWLVSNKFY